MHIKSTSALALALLIGASPLAMADSGKGKGHDKGQHAGPAHNEFHGGPSIDRGGVRGILDGHRDYWRAGPALPPGVQKNLARGKPLPPGIAKKLDGRLVGRLPHYEGYEWRQAGADLLLVTIATGVIYEVLHDVLH